MHLRITNNPTRTYDVLRLGFESAGALERFNEYSGNAVAPALYIAFAVLKQACPIPPLLDVGGER